MSNRERADTVRVESITLERRRLDYLTAVDERVLASAVQRDVDYDPFSKLARLQFTTWVMATQPERIVLTYPRDWWQAVKARWWPAWLLRRWPVRYTTVTVEKYAVYPEVPIPSHAEHFCPPMAP